MKALKLIFTLTILVTNTNLSYAQDVCDTAAPETCQKACITAQPACAEKPPLTLSEVRALISEKCGCTITEATEEGASDTCSCTSKVRNFGAYRSCVAKLSESLKTFKLSSDETRNQLKADNTLCKNAIQGDDKGKNGSEKNGGEKDRR